MAALQDQIFQNPVAEMVDDNMDVTFDYGDVGGDDDIDIDIDLTTGHEEDDQMVDDHHSDIDIEDAAAEEGDDLMVDDEPQSSDPVIDMNDRGTIEPEDLQIDDAHVGTATEPFTTSPAEPNNGRIGDNDYVENSFAEVSQDNDDHFQVEEDEDVAVDLSNAQEDNSKETVLQTEPLESVITVTTSEKNNNNNGKAEVLGDTDLVESILGDQVEMAPKLEPPQGKLLSEATQAVASQDSVDEGYVLTLHEGSHDQPPLNSNDNTTTQFQEVRVLYNNDLYYLVSSSEDDDPNNFFFNNDEMMRLPLSTFLGGLRDVLQDDLTADDQLCLVINDLAVDISETTAPLYDFTFHELVDLRKRLLSNEGVSEPEAMLLSLSIKADVAKRVKFLTDSADAGKGLSQLIKWVDVESPDDFEEAPSADGDEHEIQQGDESGANEMPEQHDSAESEAPDVKDVDDIEQQVASVDANGGPNRSDEDKSTEGPSNDIDGLKATIQGTVQGSNDEDLTVIAATSPLAHQEGVTVEAEENGDDVLDYSDEEADYGYAEHKEETNNHAKVNNEPGENENAMRHNPDDNDDTARVLGLVGNEHEASEGARHDLHEVKENAIYSMLDAEAEKSRMLDEQSTLDSFEPPTTQVDEEEIDFDVPAPDVPEAEGQVPELSEHGEDLKPVDEATSQTIHVLDVESNESEPTLAGDDAIVGEQIDGEESEIDYDDDDKADVGDSVSEDAGPKRSFAELDGDANSSEQDLKRIRS